MENLIAAEAEKGLDWTDTLVKKGQARGWVPVCASTGRPEGGPSLAV